MTPRALQLFGHVPEGHRILEVGPSYNPLFSKNSGRPVSVLDHATRDELIAKYSNDPGADHTRIEEVDRGGSVSRYSVSLPITVSPAG
jgi:hypothetical protein